MTTAGSVAILVLVVVIIAVASRRAHEIRSSRAEGLVWIWLGATGLAVLLTLPPIAAAMTSVGFQGLNALVINLLAVVAVAALVELFRTYRLDDRRATARFTLWSGGVAIVAMLGFFACAHSSLVAGIPLWEQKSPWLFGYWCAYAGFALLSVSRIGRVAWTVQRNARPGVLRTSMRMMLVAVGWVFTACGLLVLDSLIYSSKALEALLVPVTMVAVAFAIASLTWPSLSRTHRMRNLRSRLLARRLEPLWRELVGNRPEYVLARADGHSPEIVFSRMLVEISDCVAELALRQRSPDMTQSRKLAGLRFPQYRAWQIEASAVAAWIAARSHKVDSVDLPGSPASEVPGPATADWADQEGYWVAAADAVRRREGPSVLRTALPVWP